MHGSEEQSRAAGPLTFIYLLYTYYIRDMYPHESLKMPFKGLRAHIENPYFQGSVGFDALPRDDVRVPGLEPSGSRMGISASWRREQRLMG